MAVAEEREGGLSRVYVQHISSTGLRCSADGIAITDDPSAYTPIVTHDGVEGAFVVWVDGSARPYAQKIDAGCSTAWAENGVPVALSGGALSQVDTIRDDGAGGLLVAWEDGRTDMYGDLYAQRLSPGGSPLWNPDGVQVTSEMGMSERPVAIAPDGTGGAFLSWFTYVYPVPYMVQRIDQNGTPLWGAAGVSVSSAPASQSPCGGMVPCSDGGVIVAWTDNRNDAGDIYAQKLDGDGNLLWGPTGLPVIVEAGRQGAGVLIRADESSAILAWNDERGNSDIYIQKLDSNGALLWAAGGVPVCTDPAEQRQPRVIPDDAGGAILAWEDRRNPTTDVYAQRVLSVGDAGTSAPPTISSISDVPSDQGGWVNLQWERSFLDRLPETEITHYSVWRRMPEMQVALARTAATPGTPHEPPRGSEGKRLRVTKDYAWEWLEDVPAHQFELYSQTVPTQYDSTAGNPAWHWYMVSAHTADPALYFDSLPDSGYSVDNLSPQPPASLAGMAQHDPTGLLLTWDANTESDLGLYRVYRGLAEDFVPGPDNLLATPVSPTYFDDGWSPASGYYYKVSASDVHGNESTHALLRPEEVTGVEPFAIASTYLRQNYPNPFTAPTEISFGLHEAGPVSLRIFDSAGRLVRALVSGARPAGPHRELWDGCDSRGAAVASGVYFYRLDASAFTQTRRMVLLR